MFDESYKFVDHSNFKAHSFKCMGGLCEILIETPDKALSLEMFKTAYTEAKRIEQKFSRYDNANIISKINNANGKKISLDKETAKLIHYANQIFEVSNGFFDITSGVLRKVWNFDQSTNVPSQEDIKTILPQIGWEKAKLEKKALTLPKGFEIDLGGIGKEYAVDSCTSLLKESFCNTPALVNFGGDIAVTGPKLNDMPWSVQVDSSDKEVKLFNGGLATSGDKNKFLLHQNKKLSHILNPKTGWPITDAPTSITVISNTCTGAGTLSTLAFLKAPHHKEFLDDEAEEYFILK